MSEEIKYCKFCDKEKPIKEFCKSGGFIKNICRECQNKKQKQIYQNSKKVNQLQYQLQQKENIIKEVREILNNKREISVSQLLDSGYCNYEELLYQVDEEIRRILDKEVE